MARCRTRPVDIHAWPTTCSPASAPRPPEEWGPCPRPCPPRSARRRPSRTSTTPPPVAEMDRSLALFDGDRWLATAGIYSRTLTVPGAVVPCAGVTWVTVAPTHPPARRADRDHAAAADRAARAGAGAGRRALGVGVPDLRPVRLRAGGLPRRADGRSERLRLRPDVDLGTGTGATGRPRRPTSRRPRRCYDAVRRSVPGNLDARRAVVGPPAAATCPTSRDGATALRVPAAHRDRRHGDRLRRLADEGQLGRRRGEPDGTLHRRGGAGQQHPRPTRRCGRCCCRSTWCAP